MNAYDYVFICVAAVCVCVGVYEPQLRTTSTRSINVDLSNQAGSIYGSPRTVRGYRW